MDNTAPPPWVGTRGSRWLAHKLPCSPTVTWKDSMNIGDDYTHSRARIGILGNQEVTALPVIPHLALAQKGNMMFPTLVTKKQCFFQITATSTLNPWGTSWFSDVRSFVFPLHVQGKFHNNELSRTRKKWEA